MYQMYFTLKGDIKKAELFNNWCLMLDLSVFRANNKSGYWKLFRTDTLL